MPISSGIPAPEFELFDDSNTLRKLSEFQREKCSPVLLPEGRYTRMYKRSL